VNLKNVASLADPRMALVLNPNGLKHVVKGTPEEPVTAVVTQGIAVVSHVKPQVTRTLPEFTAGLTDLQKISPSDKKRPSLVSVLTEVGRPDPPTVASD